MRGECDQEGGFPRSCPYDGEPQPLFQGLSPELRNETLAALILRCPYLVFDDQGNLKPDEEIITCCDHVQVKSFTDTLMVSDAVVGRCPVCSRNFARQICEMNCSPRQAEFVDVYTVINGEGVETVAEIDYRMHEDFMVQSHASCAGVLVPQTGMPAINLMCGDAQVCDPESWYGFSGNAAQNPLTSTQVNFLKWPTTEDSMVAPAPPCNETLYDDLPCSCIDCFQVCPTGTEPFIPEVCTVLSVNCISFSVSIVVIVLSVVVIIFLSRKDYNKSKTNDSKPMATKNRKISNTTQGFQFIFEKIGIFSARNPVLMIMIFSWIAFAMMFGIFNLTIHSAPIDLWSAVGSRSRDHFDYFNSRFGAFYRASQVFLQFTGLEPFTENNQTFGPAYRFEALEELIKLEDLIIDIGRDTGGVVLEDVCYAPMRQRGGEANFDQCVSMSATTYLGDSRNNLNRNTYLSLITNCLNNYLSLGCQASWGGGAQPELAIGGWTESVLEADTLLINFPIAGELLEQNLRPVLEWEAKFLELMRYYEENLKPDFVTVSYAAERSIEDELQRVSFLEAVPISISYILMIIYVTISLGKKKILNDDDPLNNDAPYRSAIASVMEPYTKALLQWWVKLVVVIVFVGFFCAAIMMIPHIEIGLDQEMALPKDSYVYSYLESVKYLLKIGPPVFFVLKSGLNFTDPLHQNAICGGILCNEDSLATQIFLAARHPEITYISTTSNSWLDDFFDWTVLPGVCCRYNATDNGFCPSVGNEADCLYCDISPGEWQNGLRPAPETFERYIPFFLQDAPTEICNKGGLASYSMYVNYILDSEGRASVHDTAFMAYHAPVSTSYDFITAVKYGYEISENITRAIQQHTGTDVEVFPYSVFYVFFEQYLNMWQDTFLAIGLCVLGAAILNFIASGFDFLTTFAVMCTVIMVVLDMMGIMYMCNIPLNAVSTINLIVSIGITVEFCSHIAYAFAISNHSKEGRIIDAMERVGATVITGITFTNIPIIVLAFSYTEIIEVFFFRMNISLVILGVLHSMIFFPVFLSYLSNIKCFSCKRT
ncbi:patched family domain-containing protein [Phthorimaea operculella]|nr:patched family domain-containing protein [Phthorimaea operculella]